MMFLRQPRLPIDSEMLPSSDNLENQPNTTDFIQDMTKIREDIKVKACSNITRAQKSQKDYYDRRHAQEVKYNIAKVN